MSSDLDKILRRVTVKPSEEIKRRRVRGPKPVPQLDDHVWESYQTGQTLELGPVDPAYVDELIRLFKQSARHVGWREFGDADSVKISLQVVDRPSGKQAIRFLARPPMDTGARVHRSRR